MDKVEHRLKGLVNEMSKVILYLLGPLNIKKRKKRPGEAIELLHLFRLLI